MSNTKTLQIDLKTFHHALGIFITMQCPLECAHCADVCSPKRTEFIDRDLISSALEDIGRAGKIKSLIVTGGEPFIAKKTIKAILEVASKYNIKVLIITSAYWATSKDTAKIFLNNFSGLTNISVSTDEYHTKFVSLEYVQNALNAALDLGIGTGLSIRVWDKKKDPFLQRLEYALGKELLDKVEIDLETINIIGRAKDLPKISFVKKSFSSSLPEGACELANFPSIDCDGTVLACCASSIARKNKSLQLGNLKDSSFVEISKVAESNNVLQTIRVWGPKRLAEILIENGLGSKLNDVYSENNICTLCNDILSKPNLVTFLKKELEKEGFIDELVLGRFLKYGELMHIDSLEEEI